MTIRYFYDTEFIDDGRTIDLISIGIACEDGREYYAVATDAPWDRIYDHEWLMTHVWPHLPVVGYTTKHVGSVGNFRDVMDSRGHLDTADTRVKPRWVIAREVREFLTGGLSASTDVELWADYAAYDHVALAQLWGPVISLPEGIPMYTNDIQTYARLAGVSHKHLPQATGNEHHALADARHVWDRYTHIRNAQKVRTR